MDWRTWHFSWMQRAHHIEKAGPPFQVSLLHSFPPWMTLIGQTLMCSQVHTALCISSYLRCQWWRCADYHWRVTDGSRQTDRRRIKGRKGVLSHLLLLGVARNCQWFYKGRVVVFVVKHHVLNSSEKTNISFCKHYHDLVTMCVCGRWRKGCFWFSLSPTV